MPDVENSIAMQEADVQLALLELTWIQSPSNLTKGKCLADLKRQGISLKAVVSFFKAHPQIDWWLAMNEVKKPATTSQRGEAVKSRTKEEIESESKAAAEAERTDEAARNRAALVARLQAAGIRISERGVK